MRKGGLQARIVEFYDANPDEELTYGQMVDKFHAPIANVRMAVYRLKALGLIEPVHLIRKKHPTIPAVVG